MGSLACRAGENKKLLQNATYGLSALKTILDAMEGSGFATGTDSLKVISDVLDLIRTELTFQHQADATLSQANPVQNTYYTILDTTLNAKIYGILVVIATTGETLQVRITVDGQTLTSTPTACTAGTNYFCWADLAYADLTISTASRNVMLYDSLECRSVKVEVRKTTAAGSGTLTGRVTYGKR